MSHHTDKLKKVLEEKREAILRIKVKPGAGKDEIIGALADGTVKIGIAAAPEKGKANARLIAFLAKEFGVKKQNVEIVSGQTAKLKIIRIKK